VSDRPRRLPGRALSMAVLLSALALAAAAPPARAPLPADLPLAAAAPDSFLATFETTKGAFTMKACRAWAPLGVDRLYHLVNGRYFDGLAIYRVGETKSVRGGRVVQFGQSGDTTVNHAWERATIPDEPVTRTHRPGSVNFARGGPNTRGVEIAICTNTVTALDTVQYLGVTGFPVVAEVVTGLDVLAKLEGRYGNAPIENDSLAILGGAYLDRAFPGLDRIRSARITKAWGGAKGAPR
jgi:peptidyl-prolyl cis-trans isomerase A (cyclophilin A)